MANRRASIWAYKKVEAKWRYAKPLYGRNNKIKPEPGAVYYVRWYDGKKTVWSRCSSAATAVMQAERREAYMNAFAHGLAPSQTFVNPPSLVLMSNTLVPWLEEYKLSHRPESHDLMQQTLHEFNAWCKKDYIAKITRVDLLRFRQHLIDKKRTPRTAANKTLRVNQFIRAVLKLDPGKGPITIKDMKFTELEPTVFNDDELSAFFKACDEFRFAIFKTYLMSGLRKAELENLTWDDVDFTAGIIRVTPKKDWQPKTWEARSIEVPDELLTILKGLTKRGTLVFANAQSLVERVNSMPYPPTIYSHGWIYGVWYCCYTAFDMNGYCGRFPATLIRRITTMFPPDKCRFLHLCCGRAHIAGALNVDVNPLPEVDVVADAQRLCLSRKTCSMFA
jgi:hypothetical protein